MPLALCQTELQQCQLRHDQYVRLSLQASLTCTATLAKGLLQLCGEKHPHGLESCLREDGQPLEERCWQSCNCLVCHLTLDSQLSITPLSWDCFLDHGDQRGRNSVILVIYCCKTNHSKTEHLRTIRMHPSFCGSEIQVWHSWVTVAQCPSKAATKVPAWASVSRLNLGGIFF